MIDEAGSRRAGLEFRRQHDPDLIEQILGRDAFDAPIPYFPRTFLRRAVRELLAPSENVYFVTADYDGRYAGFALAHTLGPTFWRQFARAQLLHHPVAIPWLIFRLRVVRPLGWRVGRLVRQRRASSPHKRSEAALGLPKTGEPFTWSPPRPDIGQLDQIFVNAAFRGLGIAPGLLRLIESEMASRHVSLIEAHVDAWNQASLSAFLKAGWEVYETSDMNYYVCCRPLRNRRSDGVDATP